MVTYLEMVHNKKGSLNVRKNSQNNSRSHLSNKVKSQYSIESTNKNDLVCNNMLSCFFFIKNQSIYTEIVNTLDSKFGELNIKEIIANLRYNNAGSLKKIFYSKEYKKTYETDKPKIRVKRSKISLFN
jgi:hypothetical protein